MCDLLVKYCSIEVISISCAMQKVCVGPIEKGAPIYTISLCFNMPAIKSPSIGTIGIALLH